MSKQYYEDLIRYISEAKSTRKQPLNDTPTSGAYYGVEIQTGEMQYHYFVCEEGESEAELTVVTMRPSSFSSHHFDKKKRQVLYPSFNHPHFCSHSGKYLQILCTFHNST